MMKDDMKKRYDLRFRHFIREIRGVSKMSPKEKYLYRIMDGVPFQDLETSIAMIKIELEQKIDETVNDNKK